MRQNSYYRNNVLKSKSSAITNPMIRLEKFFTSLITIILTYSNRLEDLPVSQHSTLETLENYILSTSTPFWRTDRTKLMLYILSTINLLRPHIQSPTALDIADVNEIKFKLINFITNLQKLLNSSSAVEIGVVIEGMSSNLEGCGKLWSVSRNMIKKQLFIALAIPTGASELFIRQYITDMLNEHQNPLLLKKIDLLKSVMDLTDTTRELKHPVRTRVPFSDSFMGDLSMFSSARKIHADPFEEKVETDSASLELR